jgi:polar amino acid transport system substrate-binding protein
MSPSSTLCATAFIWAVVTMTTVGYGDKTPKTTAGRVIAVVWMLASVALISILSTSIVSRMTAERVVGGLHVTEEALAGKRLAAVAHSSGAEYLDERHLRYAPFDELAAALAALGRDEVDAVVNSVGALQYLVSTRFKGAIRPPQGVLEPAYMAIALPLGSPLKKPLDEALVGIIASQEWRQIEDGYFGREPYSLPDLPQRRRGGEGREGDGGERQGADRKERTQERRHAAAGGRRCGNAEDQYGNRQRQD